MKLLRLTLDTIVELPHSEKDLEVNISSLDKSTTLKISYIGSTREIFIHKKTDNIFDNYAEQMLLSGEAVILITENEVFLSFEFNKIKKYLEYEEITLKDPYINISYREETI